MDAMQKNLLLDLFSEVSQFDPVELKREGKEFDFVSVNDAVTTIIEVARQLKANDSVLDMFPDENFNNIRSCWNQFLIKLRSIKSFSAPSFANPSEQRNQIIVDIKNNYSWLFNNFLSPYYVLSMKKDSMAKQIDEEVLKIKKKVDEILGIEEQAKKSLVAIQTATGNVGAAEFSKKFDEQAKTHVSLAVFWLLASIGFGFEIFDYLSKLFNELQVLLSQMVVKNNGEISLPVLLQLMISKVLLLSFFSVAFYQVVKNFNANMHLYTLNKHRSNCLNTFQTFFQSSLEPKIKDVILLQATKAVFDSGDTGFITTKDITFNGMETIKVMEPENK